MKSNKQHKTRVVVIGAGYSGAMAAIRLDGRGRRHGIEVTLVNPSADFVERPKLHEVAVGQVPKTYPLAQFLKGTGIRFVQGYATTIDTKTNEVVVNGAERLPYDYVLYAPGSRVDRDTVPGVADFAYTLDASGERTSTDLFERLGNQHSGHVAVIGSGPTGIEIAAEIAARYPHVRVNIITQGEFGIFKDRAVQKYMRKSLIRQGVKITEHTSVAEVKPDGVVTVGDDTIPANIVVWSGGFRALPLAANSGIRTNKRNQIITDPSLRSLSHPSIFAIGDSAAPVHDTGAPMRMGVFTALVTGSHGADTILRLVRGRQPKPLGFSTYGQGIALGPKDAVGFMTFPSDKRTSPMFTGRLGLFVRNFFVNLVRQFLSIEKRMPGFFFWFGGGRGKKSAKTAAVMEKMEQAETAI